MIVQSPAASFFATETARSSSSRQSATVPVKDPAKIADTVRISQAAREALAASSASSTSNTDRRVEERLAEIKSRGVVSRTQEDNDFLLTHDKKFADIRNKPYETLSSDEKGYMLEATGFVNLFAKLSPAEKALHDKAVASGDKDAALAFSKIGMARMMGDMAGGANGTSYDPSTKEITAANIEQYFSHSFIDSTGEIQSQFQALIRFLQNNQA